MTNEKNQLLNEATFEEFENIYAKTNNSFGECYSQLLKEHPEVSSTNLLYFMLMTIHLNTLYLMESQEDAEILIKRAIEESLRIHKERNNKGENHG